MYDKKPKPGKPDKDKPVRPKPPKGRGPGKPPITIQPVPKKPGKTGRSGR